MNETTKVAHTPGPWKTIPSRHRNLEGTIEIQHGSIGEVICTMESDDNLADAYLVRASPELLAVAEKARRFFEERFPGSELEYELCSAIARATGADA